MTRIAVLGVGRIGRMHAENIHAHPRASLAGVYDVHAPAADEMAAKLGVRKFERAEDIFPWDDVEGVLTPPPPPPPPALIEMSGAAGKPVLCEKPIDLT